MRVQAGFTLIELLVVLSIVGILATFVGPVAYQQYINVQRDADVEKLKQVVNKAQFLALSQRRTVQLHLADNAISVSSNMNEQRISFQFLTFNEQNIWINPNGFFKQRQISYSTQEQVNTLEIGRDLYEQ